MKPLKEEPVPLADEEPSARPKRPKPPQLWDDKAFRVRMTEYAKRQDKTARQVLEEIGLPREFGYRSHKTRSTNLIMYVADALNVSPAVLAGWALPSEPDTGREIGELIVKLNDNFSQERLKVLLIALAATRSDIDTSSIVELARMTRHDWAEKLNDENNKNGK